MDLDAVLARQGGVIALHQAVAAGVSARTVQRRASSGAWRALHPRVYLVGGHRPTDETRIRAAALWVGERATVTGIAAAWWHGMTPRAAGPVDITMPASVRLDPAPGVQLHRRDLLDVDRTHLRGTWVASPPLAALQAALAFEDGSTFLDRALQRHVRFPQLYQAYTRHIGARGWSRAHELIVACADRADSAAERLLVGLLRGAGIGGWELGVPFGPYSIDLAFPAARVAVEIDGWAWHVDPERFRNDRRKGNALTRAGWHLLRFTWHDLDGRPHDCILEIRETVAARAA